MFILLTQPLVFMKEKERLRSLVTDPGACPEWRLCDAEETCLECSQLE